MADTLHTVHHKTIRNGDADSSTVVTDEKTTRTSASEVAERFIWLIAGILIALLAFRFVLAAAGANASNGFANFVYSITHPFVSPFFSLFSYNQHIHGVSSFEGYTLIAIAVYALVAWGLVALVTLGRSRE